MPPWRLPRHTRLPAELLGNCRMRLSDIATAPPSCSALLLSRDLVSRFLCSKVGCGSRFARANAMTARCSPPAASLARTRRSRLRCRARLDWNARTIHRQFIAASAIAQSIPAGCVARTEKDLPHPNRFALTRSGFDLPRWGRSTKTAIAGPPSQRTFHAHPHRTSGWTAFVCVVPSRILRQLRMRGER